MCGLFLCSMYDTNESRALKQQLQTLVDLQQIDLEQEALRSNVENRRKKVESDKELLKDLDLTLARERSALSETQALLATKRSELEEARKGHEHAKTKFGTVSNSRDYASVEREIENFKKIMAQIEGELEQLNVALSEAQLVIQGHNEAYDELCKAIADNGVLAEEASAAIADQVAALQAKADKLAKTIQPQLLGRYRFIRSKRAGVAVVSASAGTCTGCHMRLQPQSYIQLQRQNSLESCQNCQRILYFDPLELENI